MSWVGTDAAVEDAQMSASSAEQAVLSSRKALAQAEARLARSNTQLARANLTLEDAVRTRDETEVFAPFDGTLTETNVVAGRLVSPNETLGVLMDTEDLELAFRVSTQQFTRLLDDQGALIPAEVTVLMDVFGAELTAKGRIEREAGNVGEGLSGRVIYARLGQAQGFRPGDFATVEVREPAMRGVALVPATAVGWDGYVMAVGQDDRLEAVEAQVLRRQGDNVIIRARALAGRQIVAARTPVTGPGIKVRPMLPGGQIAAVEPALVTLDPERRARLVAFVEANNRMPPAAKERVLTQLQSEQVPVAMVERLERRMGG